MSAVEDRIVAMKFDNKQFEGPAKTTMSTLDRLKAALSFKHADKGLNDIQAAAGRFSLTGMSHAVEQMSSKFLGMSAVAITAIANITNRAVDAGLRIANALTIAPVKTGLDEYEKTLGSTQTIMSATGESVDEVTQTLSELNKFSDRTIFSFSDMTDNIKMFTNAGISSKKSARVMMGIANAAAAAGVGADAAGRAMYGFGQSMSMGFVGLQDWNQIDNAGIATKEFKNELIDAGLKAGTLKKSMDGTIKTNKGAEVTFKNMRNTLSDQWLTSEALVATLDKYSDVTTKVGKKASNNATQVKTLTQLMGILQESMQSGWSTTFLNLFGNLKEASALWTNVNNVIGGAITKSANARNKMLGDWKALGGRTMLLKGISNIFNAIVSVVKPIRDAFREIFPATTGKQLMIMTTAFVKFTEKLKMGSGTAENLKRTFKGVFAIFDIGVSFVKAILNVIGDLFGLLQSGSGDFLKFTGSIGDWLVNLDKAIKKGDTFNKFFEKLGNILKYPMAALGALGGAIITFLRNLDGHPIQAVIDYLGKFGDRLKPLGGLSEVIGKAWEKMVGIFKSFGDFLAPVVNSIKQSFSGIWTSIIDSFSSGDFSGVLDVINTGLLAGIILLVKKFLKNGFKVDFNGGIIDSITKTFDTLTNTLTDMQTNVKAKTILTIAAAVAILAASVVVLSNIDSKKLSKAMAALAVGLGQLLGAMAILNLISGSAGFVKIPLIASSMIALSIAVLILSSAVKNLSDLSWEDLTKGLLGVGALLGMIVLTSKGLGKSSGSLLRAGLAMIPLAIGLKILASVVKDFANMSWGDMAKGLVGLAGSLLVIAGAMNLMPKDMLGKSAGLVILGVALKIIASALQDMGGMSWEEIAKGLTTLAASLLIFAGGLKLMTTALPGAAALLIAAAALSVLAPVLDQFSNMSWEEIAKGMVVLGGSLLILAGGLKLMSGSLAGSAALLVAAAALTILTPVLLTLGAMSWGSIVKGLASMAGVFAVLGLAGLLLAPVAPILLILGASLALLGAGAAGVGAGLLAVATAFGLFVAAGTAGMAVLVGMISLIPKFMAGLAAGIVTFIVTLASSGAKLTTAFAGLITSLLNAVILVSPKIGEAFNALISLAITVLVGNIPRIAAAGLALIGGLLTAINNNIGKIVVLAGSIIIKFIYGLTIMAPRIIAAGTNLIVTYINGIAQAHGRIITAGTNLIVKFLNGIANSIPKVVGAATNVVVRFLNSLSQNMPKITSAGANLIVKFLNGVSNNIGKVVNAAVNLIVKFLNGISRNMPKIVAAGVILVQRFMAGIGNAAPRLANSGAQMVIKLVNGVANAIRNNQGAMNDAGRNLGSAIVAGLAGGIRGAAGGAIDAAVGVARSAIASAKAALGVNSPSKEFFYLGDMGGLGLAKGFIYRRKTVENAASETANSAIAAVKSTMSGMSALMVSDVNLNPVIKPVLDLSDISQNASRIGGMLGQKSISADVSYRQAVGVSNNRQLGTDTVTDNSVTKETNLVFNQTINAPRQPSPIDLYRNTSNLMSMAKGALSP